MRSFVEVKLAIFCSEVTVQCPHHGRRITTEEKAMVAADALGIELLQFLAALTLFH